MSASVDGEAVSGARERLKAAIEAAAVAVPARDVAVLLSGFDALIQHVSEAHEHYTADCNNLVALRLGTVMHKLGATEVTIGTGDYMVLRGKGAALNHTLNAAENAITYTLQFPKEPTGRGEGETERLPLALEG
jgi:hypothetical protein